MHRPRVSPDGTRVAYFSTASDGSHQVRVRWLAGGGEIDCGWTERFQWWHGPFWCPDGRALLVHALERGATAPTLWSVDLASGDVRDSIHRDSRARRTEPSTPPSAGWSSTRDGLAPHGELRHSRQ